MIGWIQVEEGVYLCLREPLYLTQWVSAGCLWGYLSLLNTQSVSVVVLAGCTHALTGTHTDELVLPVTSHHYSSSNTQNKSHNHSHQKRTWVSCFVFVVYFFKLRISVYPCVITGRQTVLRIRAAHVLKCHIEFSEVDLSSTILLASHLRLDADRNECLPWPPHITLPYTPSLQL